MASHSHVRSERDPNTLSNYYDVIARHISWKFEADFASKTLKGIATLTVEALADGVKEVIVDTRDLTISKAFQDNHEIKFENGATHEVFGVAVRAHLKEPLSKGAKTTVGFEYHTSPNSTAIQWLEPSQTAGKKNPYLFTQCQAIHARSMLPCQDAPNVKTTYDATVTVPAALTAVMSAVPTGDSAADGKRTFSFKQEIPMCAYLIALGVGELESREIGPRSRVWSEKSMVDQGAYEFAETEAFLKIGEEILGPYVWGRYDILLLPPSFPYGGMENPCLTFVTPTLLAGDRSNANVIAHEISHSWTGNLVTNKTWEHFWLNEGFTVYTERKIYAKMANEQMRHLKAVIGYKALIESINAYGADSPFTALIPDLKGIDPDDAFSSVPYEKGFCFLFYLENLVGLVPFEGFLRAYIEKFKFGALTSYDFKDFFLGYFAQTDKKILDQIDWDAWFYSPGLPPVIPEFDQTLSNASKALATQWMSDSLPSSNEISSWSADQVVVFLNELVLAPKPLSHSTIQKMNELYKFSASKNSEIRFRWYQICINADYEAEFKGATEFLTEQGRMKFVRPLYKALYKSAKGKDLARKTFVEHRSMYHNIASKMVAKDLELDQ